MNFNSDNIAGASPRVLQALIAANAGSEAAYANDSVTRRVEAQFSRLFEREVTVVLVATGTAANALALAAMCPPWGAVLCHEEAHVMLDECGAPEMFSDGAKLFGIPGLGGKITPDALSLQMSRMDGGVQHVKPSALSVSNLSECGTVYRPAEVAALSAIARTHGLTVHMDGARFTNALVATGATPADMTWKAGVDVLAFGATKCGCIAAEAVVVFNPTLVDTLGYRRKRSGHLLSKGRFLAAQWDAFLADDHWLDLARHANTMAAKLSAGLSAAGVRIAWPTDGNEVFAVFHDTQAADLKRQGFQFHRWSAVSLGNAPLGEAEQIYRLVCSFTTLEHDVDALVQAVEHQHEAV
jgi:threonine aldolase